MNLEDVLRDTKTRASLFIRHAERLDIPFREVDHLTRLTEKGRHSAEDLGKIIGGNLAGVYSSSVPRCLDTSDAIIKGSGKFSMPINVNWRLGNPGVWVVDGKSSWDEFINNGLDDLIKKQVNGEALAGFRPLHEGIELLMGCLLDHSRNNSGIDVFVSHDAIIAPLIGYLLGDSNPRDIIPGYLEGTLLHQEGENIKFFWRNQWHLHPG